jgi:hypothetical protein
VSYGAVPSIVAPYEEVLEAHSDFELKESLLSAFLYYFMHNDYRFDLEVEKRVDRIQGGN